MKFEMTDYNIALNIICKSFFYGQMQKKLEKSQIVMLNIYLFHVRKDTKMLVQPVIH